MKEIRIRHGKASNALNFEVIRTFGVLSRAYPNAFGWVWSAPFPRGPRRGPEGKESQGWKSDRKALLQAGEGREGGRRGRARRKGERQVHRALARVLGRSNATVSDEVRRNRTVHELEAEMRHKGVSEAPHKPQDAPLADLAVDAHSNGVPLRVAQRGEHPPPVQDDMVPGKRRANDEGVICHRPPTPSAERGARRAPERAR